MSRTVFLILILIALSLSRHQDRLTTFVDDFSRAAANSMLANIYGYEFNHSYDDPSFRSRKYTSLSSLTSEYQISSDTLNNNIFIIHLFSAQKERVFAYRAREENLELPQIHLAINNRVIQYALR